MMETGGDMSRRPFMGSLVALRGRATRAADLGPMITKKILVSDEQLPAIDMGSWITFNVQRDGERELNSRQQNHVPIHVPPAWSLIRHEARRSIAGAALERCYIDSGIHRFQRQRRLGPLRGLRRSPKPRRLLRARRRARGRGSPRR